MFIFHFQTVCGSSARLCEKWGRRGEERGDKLWGKTAKREKERERDSGMALIDKLNT